MIEITNTEIVGWEHAIRGMRNPMNSHKKSDSYWLWDKYPSYEPDIDEKNRYIIGPNDLDLMRRLSNGGPDDRKFMRMIVVYCDILAPLYWWKEFDTYKVGTVANSCSTMHKIHAKEFDISDFSTNHLLIDSTYDIDVKQCLRTTIEVLNMYREMYLRHKSKVYWWQMIQLLPTSYNQKRTVMLNYEVLRNMYNARKAHKLDEWRDFCRWAENLSYSELITGEWNE